VRRRAQRGVCAAANHFCSADLAAEEADLEGSLERQATLKKLRGKKKLTVERLREQLDRVNQGELTLQTMAFEPATRKLHLSIGRAPASGGRLRPVAVREVLRGKKEDVADRR